MVSVWQPTSLHEHGLDAPPPQEHGEPASLVGLVCEFMAMLLT
jgi:hypothetical protein